MWSEINKKREFCNLGRKKHGLIKWKPSGHPVLQNILTTQDAKKLRHHLKFLTCDYLTANRLYMNNNNLDNSCKLCQMLDETTQVESIEHILVSCKATAEVRSRLRPGLLNTVAAVQPCSSLLMNDTSDSELTQFILDCTSPNLPNSLRIPAHNPRIS